MRQLLPRLAPAQLLSSCDGRGCGCCGDFGADAPGSSATAPVSAVAVATAAFALAAFGMTLAQVHSIISRWFEWGLWKPALPLQQPLPLQQRAHCRTLLLPVLF